MKLAALGTHLRTASHVLSCLLQQVHRSAMVVSQDNVKIQRSGARMKASSLIGVCCCLAEMRAALRASYPPAPAMR